MIDSIIQHITCTVQHHDLEGSFFMGDPKGFQLNNLHHHEIKCIGAI